MTNTESVPTIDAILNDLSAAIAINHTTSSKEGYQKKRKRDDAFVTRAKAQLQRICASERLEERQGLSFHRAYGKDYQETLEHLEEQNEQRKSELQTQLEGEIHAKQ